MRTILAALAAASLSACATTLPAPEVRKVQFVDDTKASKAQAYNRALAHLGKKVGDSNAAIQVRNAEDGQIVAKLNVNCEALHKDPLGIVKPDTLHFNLDFKAKDNKTRMSFEDLEMHDPYGAVISWDMYQVSSPQQVEKVKPCLQEVREQLTRAIAATSDF